MNEPTSLVDELCNKLDGKRKKDDAIPELVRQLDRLSNSLKNASDAVREAGKAVLELLV